MRRVMLVVMLSMVVPCVAALEGPAWAAKKADKKEAKSKEGVITWKVEPADVIISVDGKKVGTAAKAQPFKAKAGMHMIKLIWGKDEAEEPIEVKAGESVEFQYMFEDSGKKPAQ